MAPLSTSPGYWRKKAFTQSKNHLTKWHPASGSPMTDNPTIKFGVYKIPDSCGKIYIGQRGHHISTRVLEPIRDTRLENQ
jgi:hypothetical protein